MGIKCKKRGINALTPSFKVHIQIKSFNVKL